MRPTDAETGLVRRSIVTDAGKNIQRTRAFRTTKTPLQIVWHVGSDAGVKPRSSARIGGESKLALL